MVARTGRDFDDGSAGEYATQPAPCTGWVVRPSSRLCWEQLHLFWEWKHEHVFLVTVSQEVCIELLVCDFWGDVSWTLSLPFVVEQLLHQQH